MDRWVHADIRDQKSRLTLQLSRSTSPGRNLSVEQSLLSYHLFGRWWLFSSDTDNQACPRCTVAAGFSALILYHVIYRQHSSNSCSREKHPGLHIRCCLPNARFQKGLSCIAEGCVQCMQVASEMFHAHGVAVRERWVDGGWDERLRGLKAGSNKTVGEEGRGVGKKECHGECRASQVPGNGLARTLHSPYIDSRDN